MPKVNEIAEWESLIGETPLFQLSNLLEDCHFQLFGKLEMFNLGGSMKDRSSLSIIRSALERKLIKQGSTVIESTSGNMGVGLAQACLRYGLQLICVVDSRANVSNIQLMRTYGARIEPVTQTAPSQSLQEARIARVQELLQSIPGSFWCNQYANEDGPKAHWATMEELSRTLSGKIDYLLCATGTCGTIRGCSDYIKKHGLKTTIVAVDATGSAIFGRAPSQRLIPGHGSTIRPPLFHADMADTVLHVSDADCVAGCRRLLAREAILAGGSSGALVSAVEKLQSTIPVGANVVLILADRGERYLETIYNDEWVTKNNLNRKADYEKQ